MSALRLLVGTRKGAFVLTSDGTRKDWNPAPKLGQHTEEVFASWLNLSSNDIAKLREQKVLG